jgi:hypothetical protein
MLVAACSGCDRARPAPPGPALPVSLSSAAGKAARISIADDAELEPVTGIVFRELKLDDVHYDNGNSAGFDTILETLGGGVAVLDYDRDGWLDLLFPGGGRFSSGADDFTLGAAPRLLRGGGGSSWLPVESSAGLTQSAPYSHGCAAADFDSDGFVDLFITGYRGVLLFRNQGDGTFVECAAPSGIVDSGWSTGAAWGDLDGDGALDLYLVRYVEWSLAAHRVCVAGIATPAEICGPKHFPAADDRIYLSRGDGTFADAGANLGLQPGGKGLSVVLGDVDLDGDLDAYVANDTTENFLYLNDGHGQLREVGVLHGVAFDEDGLPTGSMGVALADYDGDGLPDLWTTNFEFEALALYRNLGTGRFHYVSRPAGVAAIGDEFVGWGTAFVDLDRDGDLDVVVSNGHLPKYPRAGNLAQPAL